MKIRDIIKGSLSSQKEFVDNLKWQKKVAEYAKKNGVADLYFKVHNEYSPVFVLSTGRSGTAFLTHLLKMDKTVRVFHEPDPVFSFHAQFAYLGYKKKSEAVSSLFDGARYELIRNTFIEGKRYIETNNRITFFAYQIAELFPKAKFIHLVRNPVSFIKSGLGRDWYTGHSLYDEGRIIDSDDSWKSKSQIEKIGWLWNETNSFIEEFKKVYSNVLTVKAEELFVSSDEQLKIFEFLNIVKPTQAELKSRTSKRINEGKNRLFSLDELEKIEFTVNGLALKKRYKY